jgi:hypothetical protein
MKGFFERAFHLTFAGALLNRMQEPRSIRLDTMERDYHKVLANPWVCVELRGRLALREHGETGETTAELRLLVSPLWLNLLPSAYAQVPFLRPEIDWHASPSGYLCYSQDREWKWKLAELWNQGATGDQIINLASGWCIRNIDSLLTRHLHAYRYGIKKWPHEWGQWSHYEKGVEELENLIQKENQNEVQKVPTQQI